MKACCILALRPHVANNLWTLAFFGSQWSSDGVLEMLRFFNMSLMIGFFLNRARVIVSIPHTFLQKQMVLTTGAHILFHFMRPPDHDLPVSQPVLMSPDCREMVLLQSGVI